jgi:Tfp pilus assembly ATPase PilU
MRAARGVSSDRPRCAIVNGCVRRSRSLGTGHLCIATLHANNASETLDRIVNLLSATSTRKSSLDLSQYLRAIVAQYVSFAALRGRHAAVEDVA